MTSTLLYIFAAPVCTFAVSRLITRILQLWRKAACIKSTLDKLRQNFTAELALSSVTFYIFLYVMGTSIFNLDIIKFKVIDITEGET